MVSRCTLAAPLEELWGILEMQYFILLGCGVAQLVVRRLAVRQAQVQFSARHSMETLLLLFSYYFAHTKYTSEDSLLLRSSIIWTCFNLELFLNGSETLSLITLR